MIKVIICDDHRMFRLGMKSILAGCGDITVEAEAVNGEQTLAILESVKADIVLLDIIMPGIGGVETARRIRRDYPEVKILVISSENSEDTLRQLVEIGINSMKEVVRYAIEHGIINAG
jgi:DNA-binding NarL/FixJ family response regulator